MEQSTSQTLLRNIVSVPGAGRAAPSHLPVLMTPGGNMQHMLGALAALTASSGGFPKPEEVRMLCAEYDIMFAEADANH